MSQMIAGKKREQWLESFPLLNQLIKGEETFWFNRDLRSVEAILPTLDIGRREVQDAADRWDRFAPYLSKVFPETRKLKGIIESSLQFIPKMQKALSKHYHVELPGSLMLKCDHNLPVSGSIKARGGIYEVLKHAESLAIENGRLSPAENYACLSENRFIDFFSRYTLAVGSTGNLGLSIGIMGACLGFKVIVHMSAEAKKWKKTLLRSKGVKVIEHAGDYSKAVAQGRKQAEADPNCHFIDDENSKDLFMGYAVAARRLKSQLDDLQIKVDQAHPLFVYLPCGVGGAPGGITFGLKLIFDDNVHCLFAEPTHAPAMFLGVYTDKHDAICVQDFGIDHKTEADGLAVGRPSGFVGKRLKTLIDAFYTLSDTTLYRQLALLADCETIFMEPSAVAGLPGIAHVMQHSGYINHLGVMDVMNQAVHIAWGTGGSMVPESTMEYSYLKGKRLLNHG